MQLNCTIQLNTSSLLQQLIRGQREQGVMSSFVSWIATGYNQPSFIEGQSCAEFPWFAFSVILAEREIELSTELWSSIQSELFNNPALTIEAALKVCVGDYFGDVRNEHSYSVHETNYQTSSVKG